MRVLILGGHGMAGHMILSYFQNLPEYEVYYTTRNNREKNGFHLDVNDTKKLEKIFEQIKPHVTINCIGILNEAAEKNPKLAIQINSLLPYQIVSLVEKYNGSLIHISTDCVFSGDKGNYKENDKPDGVSMYSRTKQMGEIISDNHLTVRTSIIGPELKEDGIGLFLWFMKQRGEVRGYTNVFWNGVTTLELSKILDKMIRSKVKGLYHIGSDIKISKYELLKKIQNIFQKTDVKIIPYADIMLDRTIINTRTDFRYKVLDYDKMLYELKEWMTINKN